MFTNHWQCSIKGIKIKKEEKNWKRIYYLNKERPMSQEARTQEAMLDCWCRGAFAPPSAAHSPRVLSLSPGDDSATVAALRRVPMSS